MFKKLWEYRYLKPIDYIDMFQSENIEKGKKMHEAVSKRMKELIASGPLLKFVGPTTPICFEHFVDDIEKVECDCEVKILKIRNSQKPVGQWFLDSEAKFDEKIMKDFNVICDRPTVVGKIEELQASKPNKNGDMFPSITAKTAKLQMNGRQLRTEKIPINGKYDIVFVNFSIVNDPIDPKTKIKSCNPQGEQILDPNDVPIKQENKSSQVSICSSCNYYNEWIPFDPNYKCYKCKKGL